MTIKAEHAQNSDLQVVVEPLSASNLWCGSFSAVNENNIFVYGMVYCITSSSTTGVRVRTNSINSRIQF